MSSRWLLWACLFPAIWGCVSLDYYEALREAYEKAEGRSLAANRDLNRTKVEMAQLQKELAQMKLAEASRPAMNGEPSVRERADLLARRLEATQAELRVRDEEKARLDRELGVVRTTLAAKDEQMRKALHDLEASLKEEIEIGRAHV